MQVDFDFDVFLSHSALDKTMVRTIAERLRADGLRVWFDEWVLRPGDNIRTEIEVIGVRQSNSRKDYGVVRTRTLALNQRNEVVMRSTVNFLAPVRPQA